MKSLLICATTLFAMIAGSSALAAGRYYSSSHSYDSSDDVGPRNFITGALGFMAPGANTVVGTVSGIPNQQSASFSNSGLFGVGGDYDYMFTKNFSLGGFVRYYNTSTTIGNQSFKNSLFALGPQVKAYLPTNNWLPYFTSGLSYLAPDFQQTNAAGVTTDLSISGSIGIMFGIGIMYQVSSNFAIGIENMKQIGLANSVNGVLTDDYMIKGRFGL